MADINLRSIVSTEGFDGGGGGRSCNGTLHVDSGGRMYFVLPEPSATAPFTVYKASTLVSDAGWAIATFTAQTSGRPTAPLSLAGFGSVIDADDRIHIAFIDVESGDQDDIFYTYYDTEAATPTEGYEGASPAEWPIRATTNPGVITGVDRMYSIDIAVDSGGTIFIATTLEATGSMMNDVVEVWMDYKEPSGSWSSTDGNHGLGESVGVTITVDDDDVVHLFWYLGGDDCYHDTFTVSGGFGGETDMGTDVDASSNAAYAQQAWRPVSYVSGSNQHIFWPVLDKTNSPEAWTQHWSKAGAGAWTEDTTREAASDSRDVYSPNSDDGNGNHGHTIGIVEDGTKLIAVYADDATRSDYYYVTNDDDAGWSSETAIRHRCH